jgi:pyrroloquinoline quinone biosynthesis protein D
MNDVDDILNSTPSVSSMFRLQWEEVQQCWVLLYPEGMVKLNGSAGEIMRRLNGEKTVQTVISDLETDFGTTGLQADVLAFLEIAGQQGWVKA